MPLFWGDLLAATSTWEGEERALYTVLLAYQWTNGPLPNDPQRLAKMCQYDQKNFRRLWVTVGPKFSEIEGGLANSRLEHHRLRVSEISNKRSDAASAKRANKTNKSDANGVVLYLQNGSKSGGFVDATE
jgi:uncharacterized protein YdaU (DUF1376 family)